MARLRFAYVFLFMCSNGAACELPALAVVPTTIGDNVAGVLLDVRRYSDAIIEYTACLKAELAAAGGDSAPALVRSVLVGRNNYAVAEHKAVTDLYTARVGLLENLRLAEYLDGETRDCLFGSSVARIGVVNKGAVLFFLRGGTAYLNVLEATCPELEREDGFFVGDQSATGVGVNPAARGVIGPMGGPRGIDTPLSNRICDQDRIFPYREGSTRRVLACDLGRFFAVSEDEALHILATFDSPLNSPGQEDTSDEP